MGHVVNAYLYRLKFTNIWNVSCIVKKKYAFYFDINNILIYNYIKKYFASFFDKKDKIYLMHFKLLYVNNFLKLNYICPPSIFYTLICNINVYFLQYFKQIF